MTRFRLLLVVALALLTPLASATPGPFAGVLREGQDATHHYDNNPTKQPCLDMVTTYSVTLSYAPTTDVLGLRVNGREASGNGATVTFLAGVCTAFDIVVTGQSVERAAAYVVTVRSGSAAWD